MLRSQYFRQCPVNHYPYTIQSGDTLNQIAYRLEVSVARIITANPNIDPYNLGVGQVICIPACPPNHFAIIIQPGDTLYDMGERYHVTIESILEANPSVEPNYLRVGQRICIPSACKSGVSGNEEMIDAMQKEIEMLKKESSIQKNKDSNYGTGSQTTRALKVTLEGIMFDVVPIPLLGNYKGLFTAGKTYPYYLDAEMGGQRGITVKDDFGVWHTFGYHL
ncbi:LysM peptidoglycan-binding domain-containing protein [bacterium LRH843]|nr:LysM peptidoglycan-binding domain-containing protein [bacterium LRH843]